MASRVAGRPRASGPPNFSDTYSKTLSLASWGSLWEFLWALLGRFVGLLGGVGPSWAILGHPGQSWLRRGPSWNRSAAFLGSRGAILGVFEASPG
eukprot:4745063-Pyramimonas_sp.AAC.1